MGEYKETSAKLSLIMILGTFEIFDVRKFKPAYYRSPMKSEGYVLALSIGSFRPFIFTY